MRRLRGKLGWASKYIELILDGGGEEYVRLYDSIEPDTRWIAKGLRMILSSSVCGIVRLPLLN